MCGYVWLHGQHGGHSCATRLKSQRDELLEALTYASKVYRAHGIPTEKIEATIARYNPLFIDGVEHDPLCLKVCRSPLKECDCGAARAAIAKAVQS